MWMMGMENLSTTMHETEFSRVTQVRTGNRCWSISEGIGAVSQGLIFKVKFLFLNGKIVNAERL